ncbi:hypothetical protein BSU04_30445 [Caballeronia sordidicola]|uniref:Uncharacterized protein n=1 Tax=Caballeronia sordidicola TaxID=196367 RepID=A0A226WVI3_CABSO|nr:hypothetical protein BSU04_30445 [Caballeronia sordidicola]
MAGGNALVSSNARLAGRDGKGRPAAIEVCGEARAIVT